MTVVLMDTETDKEHHVTTEAETRVMPLRAKAWPNGKEYACQCR